MDGTAPEGFRWRLDDGSPDREQALFDLESTERHIGRGEYRGLEFIHVKARTIINEVPASSRMAFRYTINPYRGCSHACAYCMEGETRVLMGDGRTKSLAEIRPGDRVYGTVRVGGYRRYVVTPVLHHWSTVKRAYRITLEDGTELVASGDHRFLSDRGWKYVTGSEHGPERPHLTTSNSLIGTGRCPLPPDQDRDYCRGYLCGVIRGDDHLGTYATTLCLSRLAFDSVIERPADRAMSVRVRGLPERLRFFMAVDPAIEQKRSIEGTAIKSHAPLGVVSIEPLGKAIEMFDITTGTGDFIANGVVSHNCFARPTHEYLGLGIGEDFERRIVVKVNAVELARVELASPRWKGELIAMGTNTDPYQHAEGKYHLTKGIVNQLSEARNPFSILTKSTLILRDLPLLAAAAKRADVRVNLSIGTLDREVWRLTEPGTPPPDKRLEVVRRLNEAGVPCGVLIAPVLPGLSDSDEQVREVAQACRSIGAPAAGAIALHLRPGVKEHYLSWLGRARPDLVSLYAERFARGSYQPKAEQERLSRLVRGLMEGSGEPQRSNLEPGVSSASRPPREEEGRSAAGTCHQLSLFS